MTYAIMPNSAAKPVRIYGQGGLVPVVSGRELNLPSGMPLATMAGSPIDAGRPMHAGWRPGTYDPPASWWSNDVAPVSVGVQNVRGDIPDRMSIAVRHAGAVGTRMPMPAQAAARGVRSLAPIAETPAGIVLTQIADTVGPNGPAIGSPVTAFSRLVEAQMSAGGVIPETGQQEVRRFTTQNHAPATVLTPGHSGQRTAGIWSVRGGVAPLPGTPFYPGGALVAAPSRPHSHGGPALAVGTEAFGTPGAVQDAYVPQPAAGWSGAVRLPAGGAGRPVTPAMWAAIAPGYLPHRAGSLSGVAPLPEPAALAARADVGGACGRRLSIGSAIAVGAIAGLLIAAHRSAR